MAVRARLALVLANQEILEEVAQELEGDVLERECGTVEQLEQVEVVVETAQWRGLGVAESRVTAVDDALEVIARDLGGGDV